MSDLGVLNGQRTRSKRQRLVVAGVVLILAVDLTAYLAFVKDARARVWRAQGVRVPASAQELRFDGIPALSLDADDDSTSKFTLPAAELPAFLSQFTDVIAYYPGWYSALGYQNGTPEAQPWPAPIAPVGSITANARTGRGRVYVEWHNVPTGARISVTVATHGK